MYHKIASILDPNTRRRLRRFGKIKRARWSLVLLLLIFFISLFSDFIANDKPLLIKKGSSLYFPIFKFYPEDTFTGSGNNTRVDYKELEKTQLFSENRGNWMWWPLIRFGPNETLKVSDIEVDQTLTVRFTRLPRLATIDFDSQLLIQRSRGAAGFYGVASDNDLRRQPIESGSISLPDPVKVAIAKRFENQPDGEVSAQMGGKRFELRAHTPRSRAPRMVRLSIEEQGSSLETEEVVMQADFTFAGGDPKIWGELSETDREKVVEGARSAKIIKTEPITFESSVGKLRVSFDRETVSFPYKPVGNHPFGLDESGRDILVIILYATRIGLLFAIALVILSFCIGIFLGAVQGYFGGKIDMFGQRLTEIWAAMPFLFIMILLSSVYGKGFFLLLFVYAIFNWIGISLYMRAEFLRLRKQPFVEASRIMGISRWKIMFRSILPNALVPVITFFPFDLVGAIFSLTALDFLGFGLPAGTPSWGDLLSQGKTYPYGWWLVLFPSVALFVVSLLGIFIGEGVRAAFDPRNQSRLQ